MVDRLAAAHSLCALLLLEQQGRPVFGIFVVGLVGSSMGALVA